MNQQNLSRPPLLAAVLCASLVLFIGCGDQQEDDHVNPNCSSESWRTCRIEDGCTPVNSTFYDDERQCVDRSLHFCLNAPEPHPEMGFVTHEQTMALTDPDGNCWQFSGFYPKNWSMHAGSVCVRSYRDVSCSEKPASSDAER